MLSHASARSAGQAGQRGRTVRAVANTALVGLVAGGITMATVQVAQAATPPVAPNNIVVFPQRDFVTLEGYQNLVGQQATITVTRGGVETGRATGSVGAGDVALEVNHPGGVCWKGVTPNIKPGDTVTVSIPRPAGGTLVDSTQTLSPEVTEVRSEGAADLVISGTRAADVPTGRIEQRIVAPDLKDTAVGRRDVRAPARPGPYTSTLRFPTATTFVATYHFNDDPSTVRDEGAEMRDIAAAGQARALSWMAVNADGDRQGLTISEFGEVGGPGMGGCPLGPEAAKPSAPTSVTAAAGDGWVSASWAPATAFPDGAAIDGYRVTAVNIASGVETSVNAPVCSTACTATIPVTNGQSYRLQVQTLSAVGDSTPTAATGTVTPVGGVVQPPAGGTAPIAPSVLSASPGQPNGAINATVNWTAPVQPAGVTVDGWRVTAYNATTDARIKRVFVDEPLRTRQVSFASAGSVYFKVQSIAADDAGTLSPLSPASNTVLAR